MHTSWRIISYEFLMHLIINKLRQTEIVHNVDERIRWFECILWRSLAMSGRKSISLVKLSIRFYWQIDWLALHVQVYARCRRWWHRCCGRTSSWRCHHAHAVAAMNNNYIIILAAERLINIFFIYILYVYTQVRKEWGWFDGYWNEKQLKRTNEDSSCDVIVDVVEKNRLLLKWKFFWPFRKRCCCVAGLESIQKMNDQYANGAENVVLINEAIGRNHTCNIEIVGDSRRLSMMRPNRWTISFVFVVLWVPVPSMWRRENWRLYHGCDAMMLYRYHCAPLAPSAR